MLLGAMSACSTPEETTAEGTTTKGSSETTETKEETYLTETDTVGAGVTSQETASTDKESDATSSESEETSDTTTATESEVETETSDDVTVNADRVPSVHDQLISSSNSLANGVQAYFTSAERTNYCIENQEMVMNYGRSAGGAQLVSSLTNKQGATYVEQTMDVFVRMTDGYTYYASESNKNAEVNLYRFGYYYYEGLFEYQNFIPKEFPVTNEKDIKIKSQLTSYLEVQPSYDSENDVISFEITSITDPRIFYEKNFNYSLNEYDILIFTAKALGNTDSVSIFAKESSYTAKNCQSIALINDGEYHTYYIPLTKFPELENTLTGLRFDPNGSLGAGIAFSSISLAKSTGGVIPENLYINRHFHVYSDKMHQAVQFAVTERTENIAEVGMLTELAADTVFSLIIVTEDGKTYSSLGDIADWKSVVAVAFDVKDAGIFGYILPADDAAGNIKVELKGDKYVIEQTRTPILSDGTEGVIIPSINTTEKDSNGNYIHADGVRNNGNDFYLGQRIYTDASHDFAEFLLETGFERAPLNDKRLSIVEDNSDGAKFKGYDALRGIYVIEIGGGTSFGPAYKQPNRQYKANFNIRSDVDRDIYIMCSSSTTGCLECAALMDDNMMMLPVPIEVIKNFSEATGERNLFNISDPSFSEAIFMLSLKGNEKQEYTLLHLYQNWGNFPLKQLSQIPFHCPYYHLSTGVTETNCIVPWYTTDSLVKSHGTLPDFRTMSAPFWFGQPQHNSCGSHTWLNYTDESGKSYSVECYENIITSYGPTYAEVVWNNLSDDGKIKVTYTHMEMPETDENRTYYTMEYEFLEDLTIDNFKDNFRFYKVTDNNAKGTYKKIGYLNENNECVVVDSNQDSSVVPEYVLGDNCPYFSFFMMPDWDRESTSAEGYANVAFLVYNSDFVIGGEAYEPTFLIQNQKDYVAFTLNEAGTVNFKAGDKITINAILLPWGSQQYEDGIIDLEAFPPNYEYTMELPDGTLYMDKNVRDVRENTLLDPLTVKSSTDQVLESVYLPKVMSTDGKTATFTLSGGENNCTVKISGFDKLTAPKVEELVGGEWNEYVLSSSNAPDAKGNYHYYDGYGVSYENDSYSYSFVVDMNGDAERTFRISASDDFTPWPIEMPPLENENLLLGYTDHEELFGIINDLPEMFGSPVMGSDDQCENFVSVYVKLENTKFHESYASVYTPKNKGDESGEYLVMKYRVPSSNTENLGPIQFWTSTDRSSAGASEYFHFTPIADNQWHVAIFDLTTYSSLTMETGENGYSVNFVRADIFNKEFTDGENHIDIAYFGLDEDIMKICQLERDNFDFIQLYKNGTESDISTETGKEYVKSYLDPSSGYTLSTLPYFCILDYVCEVRKPGLASYAGMSEIPSVLNSVTDSKGRASVSGWCVVEGGVEKYVYSTDGGKTWKDATASPGKSSDEMIALARQTMGNGFLSGIEEESKVNGSFQGRIYFDLTDDLGKTVNVIFAAVPKADEKTLVILLSIDKIVPNIESMFADGSEYFEIELPYGAQVDSLNGTSYNKESSSKNGKFVFTNQLSASTDGTITIKGWCALDGGVAKYVWTADGGKTWYDCGGSTGKASDEIIRVGAQRAGFEFADVDATKKNGAFQGVGIILDLNEYKDSEEPLKIYVCAVSETAPDRVVLLYTFENVVFPSEAE